MSAILDYCNAIRVMKGLPTIKELPQGIQSDPNCCVIARATNGVMGAAFLTLNKDKELRVRVPRVIQQFICDFDRDEYPALIEEKE